MSGPTTSVLHPHDDQPTGVRPLTLPIYETSTFVFESAEQVRAYQAGESRAFLYSRYANPTVQAVEGTLAALEGAERALLFASGQAATTTTVMTLASAGDEVLCSAAIYGGTMHVLTDLLARFGLRTRFLTLDETRNPSAVISDRTRLLWFESPINPTLRCVDVGAVAAACRARGVVSVLDNTFASPVNQQPIALGVDLVMHSATKYLNGHSDVTAGVIAGPARLLEPIEKARRLVGTVLDPMPAYALGRGLKTLHVRVARQNASAQAVAEFLAADPRVSDVCYPGLAAHPDHQVARAQMSGFGGMVTFDLGGSFERAARLFDRLRVIQRAASLGGVESICSLPVLTSQYGHTDAQLRDAGITRGMVRLSVGLEDVKDLIADLDQALGTDAEQ
jgi:cystathionine beta-lyase/cystathionine gamma-synthase